MLTIIERDVIKKPQLGGWRNTITGIEYLNADSQTGPRTKRIPWEKTCSRKVQTVFAAEKECQTIYDQATQMWRRDCYIPSVSDKYVTIKPYVTYDEMQNEQNLRLDVNGKARIIQKFYKAYRVLKFVKLCARLYRKMREDCEKLGEEKALELREQYLSYCQALNKPQTLLDLDALISHLEKSELNDQHLDAGTLLESRRRVFLTVNAKMRHEQELRMQIYKARFLVYQCQPRRWFDHKNKPIEMLTLRNQAAQKFMKVYKQLGKWDTDNRMEILLQSRRSIENHNCKDANAFRDLLDQEIIMFSKEVEQIKFDFLRKRILGSFLQFIKTSHNCTCKSVSGTDDISLFDYELREPLEKKHIFCESCRKLLPCSKFPVTTKKYQIKKCKGCLRLLRNLRSHADLKPYRKILSEVREAEGVNSLSDSFSELDMYHLVLNIWHGRSIISERSDPYEFSLPRYELCKPWSPWNCIVLTREEAEMHRGFGGGGGYYSLHLRRKIRSAHRTARMDFRGLVAMEGRTIDELKN